MRVGVLYFGVQVHLEEEAGKVSDGIWKIPSWIYCISVLVGFIVLDFTQTVRITASEESFLLNASFDDVVLSYLTSLEVASHWTKKAHPSIAQWISHSFGIY